MSAVHSHSRLQLLCYSVLAFPLMFVGLPLYVFAPEFYAAEFGVSLVTLGFVMLGLRGVDALQDLLVGSLSDHFHRHRRKVMAVGMVALASGFWMVFHPSQQHTLLFFALGMLVSALGFSILSINLQALGALWNANIHERTRITSWREAFGLLGLLAAAVAPSLLGYTADAPRAFHLLTLLYVPLLVISGLIFFRWMGRVTFTPPEKKQKKKHFSRLYQRWNLQFFGIYTLNTLASAVPGVLVIFFITDRLQAAEHTGLFLLLYFLSGACSMPLWQWVARRIGKKQAWMASMLLAASAFLACVTLAAGDTVAFALLCLVAGMTLGADLALPPSILADQIDRARDHDVASYYFSTTTFLSKTALALATGVVLPILGALGYQPGTVTDYGVTVYLSYAYAVIPAILKVSVALWLWYFIKSIINSGDRYEVRRNACQHSHPA